ncbi:hypothetical protein DFJ58DRAFT_866269 [Suillus subalutaceus]|uniref:uncharacterized protein n=1 Tax=Suillus subalutaceus TaxID=48586 RepID=UPI001B85FC12|nr:uncharacterized protein DFJ58DRAFT_866269 [Suillus subalutaceus]KAG1865011.1 hypothetical protein DFJ58DRAFT_866269 [Suillus subalutaceus]
MLFTVNRTMPRALLASENFLNIMSHLNVDKRWQARHVTSSGPTLFALELPCRALSEQAFDALWDALIGVEPLVHFPGTGIIPAHDVLELFRHGEKGCKKNVTPSSVLLFLHPYFTFHELGPRLEPEPGRSQLSFVALARPEDHAGQSHAKPGQSRGFQAKPRNITSRASASFVIAAITKDVLAYLGRLSSFTSIKTRLPTGSDLENILDSSHGPILFEIFDSPPFYLNHVRVVDIDTIFCLSIGEDDLEEIGEVWPCLEALLLNQTYQNMSWRGTHATELCIGITISSVDDDYDMEKASLRALELRDSDIRLESLVMKYPCDEEDMGEI